MRRRPRTRNLIIPLIILIIGLAISQVERHRAPTSSVKSVRSGTFSGKVVGVSDGDTIRVLHNRREVNVRLWGIDSPEKRQAFGTQAKKFVSDAVFGRTVTVEVRDKDRYGRTLGWVTTADRRELNLELVRTGHAWWYREYAARDTRLAAAERDARAARRGLWSAERPVPPWDYRKRQRAGRLEE